MNFAIDSNILVSAILLPKSMAGQILSAWRSNAFTWVSCDRQWGELSNTLSRPHILARIPQGPDPVLQLLQVMRSTCRWATLTFPLPPVCRDPDDDFLFALYDQGHVNTLVSGDKDVLALKGRHPILTAKELIERL